MASREDAFKVGATATPIRRARQGEQDTLAGTDLATAAYPSLPPALSILPVVDNLVPPPPDASPASPYALAPHSAPRPAGAPGASSWTGLGLASSSSVKSPEPSLRSVGPRPVSADDEFWRLLPVARGSLSDADGRRLLHQHHQDGDGAARDGDTPTPSSAETIRRPTPLTPFPAWQDDLQSSERPASERERLLPRFDQLERSSFRGECPRSRGSVRADLHSAVFVVQCVVALLALSVHVAVFIWEKGEPESQTGNELWNHVGAPLALILVTCVAAAAACETRAPSSNAAVVCLESLVLTLSTLMALALWIWILEDEAVSRLVKAVVVGVVVAVQGTAVLAFARAALVWWLVEDGEGFEHEGGGLAGDGY
ncbi:hypothetical protein HIM_01927 [Hirsutella minnesotensis 3608]|nr:hypothetical protein HIM_01927 [Hirsutella minnesotensis 3608]